MSETVTPLNLCPTCGYAMDRATDALDEPGAPAPKPGDFSMCLSCGQPLRFTEGLHIRVCPPDELHLLPMAQRLVFDKARAYIQRRGPLPGKEAVQ